MEADTKQPISEPQQKLQGQQSEVFMDFSSMFKGKRNSKKPILHKKTQPAKTVNWLLQIPTKLEITREDIENKKVLNNKRWQSVAKANGKLITNSNQLLNMKMVASVISCWNYLYSSEGLGDRQVLKVKQFITSIQGTHNNFVSQQIDQFSRIKYIENICERVSEQTGCKIGLRMAAKLSQPKKMETDSQLQLSQILSTLKDQQKMSSYIYLAYQDVFCPIGYQITAMKPLDAYVRLQNVSKQDQQLWIICSTTGSFQPAFQIKRWKHIVEDLSAEYPQFLDIKQAKKGIQKRPEQSTNPQFSGNPNCILQIFNQ